MSSPRRPILVSRAFALTRATLFSSLADLVLFLITKRVREPLMLSKHIRGTGVRPTTPFSCRSLVRLPKLGQSSLAVALVLLPLPGRRLRKPLALAMGCLTLYLHLFLHCLRSLSFQTNRLTYPLPLAALRLTHARIHSALYQYLCARAIPVPP